jgi:hypothetical protein
MRTVDDQGSIRIEDSKEVRDILKSIGDQLTTEDDDDG